MGGPRSSATTREGGTVSSSPAVSVPSTPSPELPPGVDVDNFGVHSTYYLRESDVEFSAYGRELNSGAHDITYEFTVAGNYGRYNPNDGTTMTERTQTLAKVLKIARYDVSTRPEGSIFHASASIGDGSGASRARAYAAFGFSQAREPGDTQYAIKRGGRLQPLSADEFYRISYGD